MGILRKIFRKKDGLRDLTENESDKALSTTSRTGIESSDNAPAAQNIIQNAAKEARKLQQEFKEQDFEKQHQKIIHFRKEFEHMRMLEKLGLKYEKPKSKHMERYESLCSSEAMPRRNIDKIFLPYLIERKAAGLISKAEQLELDVILGHTNKVEDISNATSLQSYPLDYDRALIMLAVIGVLDLDKNGAISGYDSGKQLRGVQASLDCEILAKAYLVAKKNNIAVQGFPDSAKQLAAVYEQLDKTFGPDDPNLKNTPVQAVKDALKTGTTPTYVDRRCLCRALQL